MLNPNDNDSNTTTLSRAASNPLLAAAKKAKTKPGASNKRKLPNAEEQPGGLLIVRAHSASSLPPSSSLPSNPPLKKFKSSQSQLPHSQPLPLRKRYDTPDADPALDAAVRAMDTEAADLRRSSRPPDSSHSKSRPPHSSSSQFKLPTTTTRRETIIDTTRPLHPEQDETPQIQRNKRLRAGAMAAIASSSGADDMAVDPGPDYGPMTPQRPTGARTPGSSRRKSSVGRGKRISSAFETTGVITQPHHSVADTSFYKHIDADLPEAERMRMLLIWSSARAAQAQTQGPSSPSSIPTQNTNTKDPPLPPLSQKAEQLLRAVQEDGVRKLAMRMVDLSVFGEDAAEGSDAVRAHEREALAPNKQNVTNRTWEGVYSGHIQSAMEEEEAWKRVGFFYDEYARRVRSEGEKRRAGTGLLGSVTGPEASGSASASTSTPTPTPTPTTPSSKSQGKQRATILPTTLEPREQDLAPPFQAGLRLARGVLARGTRRRARGAGESERSSSSDVGLPSTSTRKGADPDSRVLPTSSRGYDIHMDMDVDPDPHAAAAEAAAAEASAAHRESQQTLRARIADVAFKLDHLYVLASQARTTTDAAQRMLDARFGVLGAALDARMHVPPGPPGSGPGATGSGAGAGSNSVLGRYVRGGGAGAGGGADRTRDEADETLRLLRALARVDAAGPAGGAGTSDAARRAAREVQRVGDAGGGPGAGLGAAGAGVGVGVGLGLGLGATGGRLTAVPPPGVGVTPRKMPGTPRRGTTPARK
ncbi:hypothetical protein H0H92_014814 [Tricholoma furcatifolium]|nr:hypothetical protein H0H92_014814 [Tricholoma furcatifolium]